MSTEYPPQATREITHSSQPLHPESVPSACSAGSEGNQQTQDTEQQTPCSPSIPPEPKTAASEEKVGPVETASSEPSPSEAGGKKQRILIGSQRDPTLFAQYKPKPTLPFPEAGRSHGRWPRRRKSKRPRSKKSPETTPEPVGEPSAPAGPSQIREPQPSVSEGETGLGPPTSVLVGSVGPDQPKEPIELPPEKLETSPPIAAQKTKEAETSTVREPAGPLPTSAGSVSPVGEAVSSAGEPAVYRLGEPAVSGASYSAGESLRSSSGICPTFAGETGPLGGVSRLKDSEAPGTSAGAIGEAEKSISPPEMHQEKPPEETQKTEPSEPSEGLEEPGEPEWSALPSRPAEEPLGVQTKSPVPNLRGKLPEDLAAEFQAALEQAPIEQLLAESGASSPPALLEPESRHWVRIVRIHREEVFVELGGREQGVIPRKQFLQPPEVGQQIEVIVSRFIPEEGLYELTLPASAAVVADWAQLAEGMVVEARVTGQNPGGLECEVSHIRGFIPISMVDLYRVSDLSEYVGQKFLCKVIECNPQRGNLVLSRRAVLEQEREETRKQMIRTLAPGQIREGVVRKLLPFGAFVDLGHGVDGLIPISQMSWQRISHPREVLQEGQRVEVIVEKVEEDSGRIRLSLRRQEENPWLHVAEKYLPNTMLRGIVRKVVDYGAFVELEPGVEGLVHISELSHKRVWRARDVVQEGQEVDVLVLSVDPSQRRISLSIRQALPPEPPPQKQTQEETLSQEEQKTSEEAVSAEPPPLPKKIRQKKPQVLKGGLGPSPMRGNRFGLKW